MEDVVLVVLVLTSIIMVLADEEDLGLFYRRPFGVRMCDRWCQQYNTTCVDTMYTVQDLTCCIQLKDERDSDSKLIPRKEKPTKDRNDFRIKAIKGVQLSDYTTMNRTCNENSGRLAKIDSQDKQDKAVKLMKAEGHLDVIIGVYSMAGSFCYIDGTPVTYSVWFMSLKLTKTTDDVLVTINGGAYRYSWTMVNPGNPLWKMSPATVLCEILN